ncbi:MAG: hypothetical protein WBB82_06450 [Limnothrix sp.]
MTSFRRRNNAVLNAAVALDEAIAKILYVGRSPFFLDPTGVSFYPKVEKSCYDHSR